MASVVQGQDLLLSQAAVEVKSMPESVTLDEGVKDETPLKFSIKRVQLKGVETQIWVCGVCGKEFGFQYALFRHFAVHRDARGFQCDVCSKIFRQASTLQQHKAVHTHDRPFACELCCKSFNRMSTLISHRKTHSDDKAFKCPLCPRAFHQKGNLRNHVYMHTNARPYKCAFCDKGFNQMSNLACHRTKMHAQEAGITFQCKICALRFAKKSLLKAHTLEQHKDDEKSSTAKRSSNAAKMESAKISKLFPREKTTVIPLVDTLAMKTAKAKNEVPFGLLQKRQSSVLLLVRIFDFGQKSIIRDATKEDLKSLCNIPIVAVIEEQKHGEFQVKMPTNAAQYKMNIGEEKIVFMKQEMPPAVKEFDLLDDIISEDSFSKSFDFTKKI
ncbi:fez family zinc finger protein 1-like [Phlebotomus argentipes]|uniref:fez family zinc finger protein 1-like n=1 Tax=Phlebotomus argentipes TaxID=94469 RepID=UPI002892D4C9|nr:fez family zinc finger protein 1-like [Phlebotomus argentipes]